MKATVIGEEAPHPSMLAKPSAISSIAVGADRLTLSVGPVRLVGSAKVATSFGCGISGRGALHVEDDLGAGARRSRADPGGGLITEQCAAKRATATSGEKREKRTAGTSGSVSSERHSEPPHHDRRRVHPIAVRVLERPPGKSTPA